MSAIQNREVSAFLGSKYLYRRCNIYMYLHEACDCINGVFAFQGVATDVHARQLSG